MAEKRLHVLVVEDDPDVARVIADMLDDGACRTSIAADGASMRDFLRHGGPVDAVILDALLPDEDGTSLADFAKSVGLPVVMCSADLAAIEFAAAHHLQMLSKPFRRDELFNALSEAIASGVAGQRET